jgi:hypothetical protein
MAIFSALAGSIAQSGAQAGGDMAYGAATQAANQNLQEAQKARAAASPWTSSGTSAVGKITNLLGLGTLTQQGNNQGIYWVDPTDAKGAQTRAMADFQTDPGYQFRVDEGAKTLDRSAAARGLLRSGAQQKALTDFGQQMGSQEYGNYFDRLLKVSGMGGESTAAANNTSAGLTQGAGNYLTQGGIARGSAYSDGAKSMASGIGKGVNNTLAGAYMFGGFGKPSTGKTGNS